jgi:hypothetical protein
VGETFYLRVTGSSSDIKIYAEKYEAANDTMTPDDVFAEAAYSSNIPLGSAVVNPILWGANGAAAENGTLAGVWQRITSPF